ncbi:transposase [Patescibacteria group bacterium]
MPTKNAVKDYKEHGIYHIYNRGVNKETFLFSEEDFEIVLMLLQRYLIENAGNKLSTRQVRNYSNEINLFAFCILENHYHFLLSQRSISGMSNFMRSLNISITYYLNKRRGRTGHLLQGVYKARLIKDDFDFIHTSKYIHLNPDPHDPEYSVNYKYSSAPGYVSRGSQSNWDFVEECHILKFFGNKKSDYKDYLLSGSDPYGSDPLD